MQVHEILRIKGTVLYTVAPSQVLGNAVATMAELDVGSLVVMEHGPAGEAGDWTSRRPCSRKTRRSLGLR